MAAKKRPRKRRTESEKEIRALREIAERLEGAACDMRDEVRSLNQQLHELKNRIPTETAMQGACYTAFVQATETEKQGNGAKH